jgi:hypothetical protein
MKAVKALRGRISTRPLADLVGSPPPITLVNYCFSYGTVLLNELVTVCQLAAAIRPATIFEIGTFEGGTTLQLAANTEARIVTLDLPPDAPKPIIDPDLDVYPSTPGWRVHDSHYAQRVEQAYGDSLNFDFSPWRGSIDLVFVDGSHHYDHCRSDSENALLMAGNDGVIAWHDYASWAPDVERVLDDLAHREPLIHLDGTSMVIRPPRA